MVINTNLLEGEYMIVTTPTGKINLPDLQRTDDGNDVVRKHFVVLGKDVKLTFLDERSGEIKDTDKSLPNLVQYWNAEISDIDPVLISKIDLPVLDQAGGLFKVVFEMLVPVGWDENDKKYDMVFLIPDKDDLERIEKLKMLK